ncbi:hypothetical protein KQ51_01761 [Candidatus Izimaplasma bacterium HR1]|jgi:hypothetical protein|uniref:hypothetical protein n=1 Tax=Candidatus Izimoplasma sp. HR1 TaxID=1541959 RepID=UPI0004F6E0C2|nr:hypothetical protein KQ51_01761 [Candidatus Izimaplasma bacterium HR1]
MIDGFSYEPGININHDLILMIILIIGTSISLWSVFYGLPYLFKADKERQARKEKFWVRFIIKLILSLYPMATFIGLPIMFSFMSSMYLVFYIIIYPFDPEVIINFIVFFSFIFIYIGYLYFFMKKINSKLDSILVNSVEFYADWDLTPNLGTGNEKTRKAWRKEDSNRAVLFYKIMIHFSTVPTVILIIVNSLIESI